jgi:hypothetical protein
MQKLQAFDLLESVGEVVKANDEFVSDLIRERLNDKGEDAKGKKISTYKAVTPNVYSYFTMNMKKAKGDNPNRVTLKDTGAFHRSFEMKMQKEFFNVFGDSDKPDGDIEENVNLKPILTLSEDEKSKLAAQIKDDLIQNIRQKIGV